MPPVQDFKSKKGEILLPGTPQGSFLALLYPGILSLRLYKKITGIHL